MRLTRNKDKTLVGLEIEAGSIAATEVRTNGGASVAATAIAPLPAEAFREGEVVDPDAVSGALKALFSEHKLSKRVRLGVANQRVIVRTLRLPAIENPEELDAAIRFQAQDQIPMPLDQAVLDHRVVGGVPGDGEDASPKIDVVVVAARRDMIEASLAPLRKAGLQPAGVDLSAFGLIRALGGSQPAAPMRAMARPLAQRSPLLQRRRRDQPRGRQGRFLPLHPRRPGRPGEHRRTPDRDGRPDPGTRADVDAARRPDGPGRDDRRRSGRRHRRTRRAQQRRLRPARRAAPLARLLRGPGGRRTDRPCRPLRPRQRYPRPSRAGRGIARPARSKSAVPPRWQTSTRPPPPA